MSVKKVYVSRLSLMVMGTTLFTSLVFYNTSKPNAYEIQVNGNCVAYVSDRVKAETINKQIIEDITKRFSNISIKSELTYQKILASENALCSDETVKKNILNTLDIQVKAVEMKIDGKTIGILANESEGTRTIELAGQHYLAESKLNNERFVKIRNKVTYTPKEIHVSLLDSPEILANRIVEDNKSKKNNILIETTGTVSEKVPVSFSTTINWSDTLPKGQSKVVSKGEEGSKVIDKQITLINGAKSSEKIIKESIVSKPKNAVILKGTKESTATIGSTSMIVPSRGSITSAFGERWGKIHEGIDIAGNTGDPIYAALAGKVIYAGWESGYGNVIKLSHNGNIETIYGHCSSISVKTGQSVSKGQVIGKVGSTGRSTGPHLHFEVRLNGKPQNPTKYIYNKTET